MGRSKSPVCLSWRIGVGTYEPAESFEALLKFLVEYRSIVDEAAFFDSFTHHLYFPLEVFAARAKLLAGRMASMRAAGIRAGINVLSTIGHRDEGWDYMPPLPFQPMVGHDGSVSRSCACPNTPAFRRYIVEKYRLTAEAGPDFVWVDDDVRMHHHGDGTSAEFGCFCPTCLEAFGRRTGRAWSREELAAALDDPAGRRWRQEWVEQNIRTLESLMADVGPAVRAGDPKIAPGQMTAGPGWTTYSGQELGRWLAALGGVKIRPGGGFYSDDRPVEMFRKALSVGRQLVGLPPEVRDRQYELENFPYCALSKSVTSVVDECTLALAAGCNGIAFNAIGSLGGPQLDERRPLMDRLTAWRRSWEGLVAGARDGPLCGLWPAWDKRLAARRQVRPGESWLGRRDAAPYDINRPTVLGELGLPLSAEPSVGTILTGRVAEAFSDEELTGLLAGGVILDARALAVLAERGLGDLTGVRIARPVDNGVKETLTDEPLNGPHAGVDRYACIEFWGDARGLADVLEPAADGVRVLAVMRSYLDETYGPCMTAFENRLGGRVVVTAYAPWMYLGSGAKREQMLNVADWITRGRLPVRVRQLARLVPLVRLSPDRTRGAVVLLNASTDPVAEATVHLRVPPARVRLLAGGRRARTLPAEPIADGLSVTLRNIAPWSAPVLRIG